MRNYPEIGVQIGEILLPDPRIDLQKWAVIACDQFTSQPEYWQKVEEITNGSPSTLNLVLPEIYLDTPQEAPRIQTIRSTMRQYLAQNIFIPHTGMVFVEREVRGTWRRGLMMALDLERYDFNKGSQSLIRATEGTILERLPPRIRIREGAPLELPHILVLIDDPARTVIEPLAAQKESFQRLYDLELMLGSGRLRGYLVNNLVEEQRVARALQNLADPETFQRKYDLLEDRAVLLFAVGDGNHSLATAKSIWEKIKATAGPDHPARYALVEVENVHDAGLEFEPIHRVLFEVKPDWKKALREFFHGKVKIEIARNFDHMTATIQSAAGQQSAGVISETGVEIIQFLEPLGNLAVGSLQAFLDEWLQAGGAAHIDYVHGDDVVAELGKQSGNLGFYLPAMKKGDLFKTVILDGSLPRKAFSMGEALEKRFYMECRRIEQDN